MPRRATIAIGAALALLLASDANAHGGGGYRGPTGEIPPNLRNPEDPPPPPDPRFGGRWCGPTWAEWSRVVVEPRGRAARPETLVRRVAPALQAVRRDDGEAPDLMRAVETALARYEPPSQPDGEKATVDDDRHRLPGSGPDLDSRLPEKATVDDSLRQLEWLGYDDVRQRAMTALLAARATLDPGLEASAGEVARPAVVLLLARAARDLPADDVRRAEILHGLRRAARASDPAVRKLALIEVARLGRGAPPGVRHAIHEQLAFHARGGPFETRPFAAHALGELVAPAPEPVVDADRLVAIVTDRARPLADRIDATRRLGRLGPYAAEWEDRWVLPWLVGIRTDEIERQVAER